MIKNKKYLPHTNLILTQKKEIIKSFLNKCEKKHKIKNIPTNLFNKIFSIQKLIPETILEIKTDCCDEIVIAILNIFRNKTKRLDFSIRALLPLISKDTKKEIITSFPQTIKKTDYYQILYTYVTTADKYEIAELFKKKTPPLKYIREIILNTDSVDTLFNLYVALKKYPITTKNFNEIVALILKLTSVLVLDKKIRSININKDKHAIYKKIVTVLEYVVKNNALPQQIAQHFCKKDLWILQTTISRFIQNDINIETVLSIEYILPLNLKNSLTKFPLTSFE